MKTYQTGTANDIKNVVGTNQKPDRWDFLFKYLKGKDKSIKILDVGCGTGNKILSLIDKGYRNTISVEYNPEMYQKMITKYHQLKIIKGNAEDLKCFRDGSFDLVYCHQVLEHLPFPQKAISEARRILKKKGAYIIGIPNGNHLNDIFLRIIQKIVYKKYDHLQRFSLKSISETLEKNSFKIIKISTQKNSFSLLLDPRIKFRWLSVPLYIFFKKIYWKNVGYDILAVKV